MRALLDDCIDAEPRWKGLLETHAHAEADDGRETAVRDGGRDEDGDSAEWGVRVIG